MSFLRQVLGGRMIVLGPVIFSGFEVPEQVSLGGRQLLAVHRLVGGGRVVDALGPDEADIGWSGILSGEGAAERLRVLESLRRGGEAIGLSWAGYRYTVVVRELLARIMGPCWVPYRVKCAVLGEGDLGGLEAPPGVASLAEAAGLGAGPGLNAALAGAEAALVGPGRANAGLAGMVARLVAARAYSGLAGNIS